MVLCFREKRREIQPLIQTKHMPAIRVLSLINDQSRYFDLQNGRLFFGTRVQKLARQMWDVVHSASITKLNGRIVDTICIAHKQENRTTVLSLLACVNYVKTMWVLNVFAKFV